MKNIDFTSLIESAQKAKTEPSVIEMKFAGALENICRELKSIQIDPSHVFSERLRWTIIDSMPWDIPFFRELMAFLGEHDKYHTAMNKLKKSEENK